MVHFACHASYDHNFPKESHIELSDAFRITLSDITTIRNFAIKDHPLIIMNACETGHLNPLFTMSFAKTFIEYGARGWWPPIVPYPMPSPLTSLNGCTSNYSRERSWGKAC